MDDLVKFSYDKESIKPRYSIGPHQIRRSAASLAHYHGVSLKDIMAAAYWRSESTFSSFYLQDVAVDRASGERSFNKLIVANAVVNL